MFEFREVAAPYPGLRPFEPHESEIFFGREGHAERLLEILQRERFLAVIGPSGCGKSSLVRAGLLPGLATGALGTGSNWRAAILRPGDRPMLALAQALLGVHALGPDLVGRERIPKDADDFTPDIALVAAELRRGTLGLLSLMQTAAAKRPENSAPFNLLVVVDQFEEIFTYAKSGGAEADESDAFIDLLLAARDDAESRIHVVLTMRTDFLGDCVRFLDLPEAINRAQYLTPRLTRKLMERAIVGPARVFGGEVDPSLVTELINSVGQDSDQLPILQHALARMWREAEKTTPTAPQIGWAAAEAVGGVGQALDHHAEEVLKALPPEQETLAETLLRAITERRHGEGGGQDVRRPQTLAAIAAWAGVDASALKPVIYTYAAPEVSFLQYGRDLREKSVIDLTHEALIRQWAALKGWVADEYQRGSAYRRWSQRAAEHERGSSNLLTGADLARTLEWWDPAAETSRWQPSARWAQRYSDLKPDEVADEFERTRQFIIDSRGAEVRQREEEHRRLEEMAEIERKRAEAEGQRAEVHRTLRREADANARRTQQLAMIGENARKRAETAEQQRTASLFDSQLTHGSLLARVEDYAEARKVLAESRRLDPAIPEARRHTRNLLAGYVELMGGSAEQVYAGAGAALVGGVAVSPDGKLLAAAGERGTLVLFDSATGELLRRLPGHDVKAGQVGGVRSVAMDPKGRWLFSGGDDERIIRWSLPAGEKLDEWQAPGAVWALALSPDGATLASGGTDRDITLWSVRDGKRIRSLEGHTGNIAGPNGLAFSPDGSLLASASFDNTARIWDLMKGETLRTLEGHNDQVEAVNFSPGGERLATASNDKQVILWDAATGHSLRHFRGHQNIVFGVTFSADGTQLLSASRDNTLRLWDVASGVTRRIYQGHTAGLLSVARHGNTLYTAANDPAVRRWSLATPDQWVWETGKAALSAAIAPDGRMVAVGLESGALRLYGVPRGQVLGGDDHAHTGPVSRIAFSADGTQLATCSDDHTAKLWLAEGAGNSVKLIVVRTFEGHTDAVHAVALSPDGRTLATAGYDGKVGLFDVASGKGHLFEAHEGNVASIAFSPEGDRLLSAGTLDFRLRLWDLADPTGPPRELAQAEDELLWAALRPDGREVAAVGRETVIALHDLAPTPGAPRRLVGHEQAVYRAVYSPDGRQLATVSSDMTVRLWDLESQRLLFTLRLPAEFQTGPLWDFDFRCTAAGECWIAVPLTVGRLVLYRLPYKE